MYNTCECRFGNETVPFKVWISSSSKASSSSTCPSVASIKGSAMNLVWKERQWVEGAMDTTNTINSFDVLENHFLPLLANKAIFPNLKAITIAGFSAGGQFVQRYAWYSQYGSTDDALDVRMAVGDPSSYLYLDSRRPAAACSPKRDTGVNWTCSKFEAPFKGATASSRACPGYDDWKYGLSKYCTYSNKVSKGKTYVYCCQSR